MRKYEGITFFFKWDGKTMNLIQSFKQHFELDKPKCPHRKLYRLPHNIMVCPECFRCFEIGSMMMARVALSDSDLEKLFRLMREKQ
uniref:ORF51 n=1 Tax=Nitrosopumilaceae spindle-shaped virus TaxID=3065433 RepID=A0AAT9JGF4_9VIRU